MKHRRWIPRFGPNLVGVLAIAIATGSSQAADDPVVLEKRVKAAFLYKFAGYVVWPVSSFPRLDTPVRIGVMGDDAVATELSQMVAGRTIERRPVSVQRIRPDEPVEGFHILFVGSGAIERLPVIGHALQSRPVLVVTESTGALNAGSMINFVIREGRVRFEISLPAAEENGLALRSGLLAVAQSVVPRTP
jgi:hypothetical protein